MHVYLCVGEFQLWEQRFQVSSVPIPPSCLTCGPCPKSRDRWFLFPLSWWFGQYTTESSDCKSLGDRLLLKHTYSCDRLYPHPLDLVLVHPVRPKEVRACWVGWRKRRLRDKPRRWLHTTSDPPMIKVRGLCQCRSQVPRINRKTVLSWMGR